MALSHSPFNYSLLFLWLLRRTRKRWGGAGGASKGGLLPGRISVAFIWFIFSLLFSQCWLKVQGEQLDSQSSAWCESLLLLLLFFPLTKLQNFLRVFVVLVSCPPCALPAWRGVRIHHHHHANGETREASRCWGWRPTGSPWLQPALPQVPAFPHILGPASSWRASPGHVQRGCLHGPPHPRQRSAAPSSALWSQHLQERPLSVLCQLGSRTRKDSPPTQE